MGLGELEPSTTTLLLVDRSIMIPRKIYEDVLVQLDKFFNPIDFFVLNTQHVMNGTNLVSLSCHLQCTNQSSK